MMTLSRPRIFVLSARTLVPVFVVVRLAAGVVLAAVVAPAFAELSAARLSPWGPAAFRVSTAGTALVVSAAGFGEPHATAAKVATAPMLRMKFFICESPR